MDDAELQQLIEKSQRQRGGKAAKYPLLEPFSEAIQKLIDNNVSLVIIRDWLEEKKGVNVVLNTLRKFTIVKIGRDKYDAYLLRNGWAKNIHEKRSVKAERKATALPAAKPIEKDRPANVGSAKNVFSGLNETGNRQVINPTADVSKLLEIDKED